MWTGFPSDHKQSERLVSIVSYDQGKTLRVMSAVTCQVSESDSQTFVQIMTCTIKNSLTADIGPANYIINSVTCGKHFDFGAHKVMAPSQSLLNKTCIMLLIFNQG